MPLVLPLGVAFEALLLLAIVLALRPFMRPLLEQLARIPGIGGWISRHLASLLDRLGDAWRAHLEPYLVRLAHWFGGLAGNAEDWYAAVAGYAIALPRTIENVITVRVPRFVGSALRPVARIAARALARASVALQLAVAGAVIFGMAWHEFRTWLLDLIERTVRPWLTGLRRDLTGAIAHAAAATFSRAVAWTEAHVLPRVGALEDAIPGLRTGIRELRDLLAPVRAYWAVVAAGFGALAVVELLRHVAGCRQRTGRLHDLDPSYWDELLALSLVLVAFPNELQAFVRTAGRAVGGLADELGLTGDEQARGAQAPGGLHDLEALLGPLRREG